MSGIAHPPGPPDPASQVPRYAQTAPAAVHIAIPVVPPTWADSTSPAAVPVASPPTQTYYVANPPTVMPSLHTTEQRRTEIPAPRPRKPYTTTKVREMWTPSEHERMIEGLRRYKRDWAKVTNFVGSRSAAQVRSHAQKYFDRVARDKTDEYVPRARPKRKSSAPYPRKVREDASKAQPPQQTYRAPVAAPYTVPVVHPSTPQFEMQPVAFASPHLHHPVRIAPGQSPVISHIPTSPYVAQPQHAVTGQVAVPHRVYSPFMDMSSTPNSNPHQRSVHATPEIQASPLSYVSGQTYATHSPAIPQQAISIPAAPMYGMLSPLTPGAFPFGSGGAPSMTHTPVTVYGHGQPGMVPTNMPVATPRHSHPEGPIESCTKCAALQRYGAVLQEIGDLNYTHAQPEMRTPHGRGTHGPSRVMNNVTPSTDAAKGTSRRTDGPKQRAGGVAYNRQAHASSGSVSPRTKRLDAPSPTCSDDGNEHVTHTATAGKRAHRAKIMRARKLKQRSNSTKERLRNIRNEYEDQSESTNSTRDNHRRVLQEKDSTLPAQLPSSHKARGISRKRQMRSHMDNREGGKKQRTSSKHADGRKGYPDRVLNHPGRESNQVDSKRKFTMSDRQKGSPEPQKRSSHEIAAKNETWRSPKSDESETGPNSPLVETYTSRERMELFDAVHSLQILAKRSSSGSPSSRSKRDARRSEGE